MERSSSTVSDFSVDRILSPQLGPCHPPEPLYGVRPQQVPVLPLPLPRPLLACRGGCSYTQMFCPYSPGFHGFYPNPNPDLRLVSRQDPPDAAQFGHYYQQHQPPVRQKVRMRTVFTESQSRHLEALFLHTDYPTAEARAELARTSGLSEETIRVWFKNRRARRKRQGGESKVKSSSPQRSHNQIFNNVL